MAIADQPLSESKPERTRADWRQDRKSGIGGSQSAAIFGEHPFINLFALYQEKVGAIEPPDIGDRLYVRLGQVMERGVGEIWAEQVGREIEFWPQTEVLRHAERPYVLCTPDAFQIDPQRGKGTVSIKTTDERFLKDWERDGIPLHYQIQAQQELAITGLSWGTVAVAFGRRTLKSFEFERNDRFIAVLLAKIEEFWRMVETQTPPDIDWTEGCRQAIHALHPEDDGSSVTLPADALDWDRNLQRVKRHIKILERFECEYENRLKAAIGPATFGDLPDGSGEAYSWKTQTRKSYVVEESTFRVLRRMKAGKKTAKSLPAHAVETPQLDGPHILALPAPATPKRKKMTVAQIRLRLLEEHPRCRWCGKTLTKRTATLEHVIPKAHGGQTKVNGKVKWEHIALACKPCNQKRGDTGLDPKYIDDLED